LGKFVAMVKFKEVEVGNIDKLKTGAVVKLVQLALGNPKVSHINKEVEKFNFDTHARCWKKYYVRPHSKSKDPQLTNTTYCFYDRLHNDYSYTKAWVQFLIEKMKDEGEYQSLFVK
jgi:hypothetical protein